MCIEIEEIMGVQTDFSSILYSRGTNLTHQCIRSTPECCIHILLISEYGHFLDRSSLLDQNSGGPQNVKTFFFFLGGRKHPIYVWKWLFWSKIGFSPHFKVDQFQFLSNLYLFWGGGPPPRHWSEKTTFSPNNLYGIRLSEISELIFLGQSNQPNLP